MTVKIQVAQKDGNGRPLKVEGDFQIVDAEGKAIEHKGRGGLSLPLRA